jgi:hypothetical protein
MGSYFRAVGDTDEKKAHSGLFTLFPRGISGCYQLLDNCQRSIVYLKNLDAWHEKARDPFGMRA